MQVFPSNIYVIYMYIIKQILQDISSREKERAIHTILRKKMLASDSTEVLHL